MKPVREHLSILHHRSQHPLDCDTCRPAKPLLIEFDAPGQRVRSRIRLAGPAPSFCFRNLKLNVFWVEGYARQGRKAGPKQRGLSNAVSYQSFKCGCFDCLLTILGPNCHDELSKGDKAIGISSKNKSASKTISPVSINADSGVCSQLIENSAFAPQIAAGASPGNPPVPARISWAYW